VEEELQRGGYIGVGEIGMDRHWSLEHIVQQEEALRIQLNWAVKYDLPVALHTRNANDEVVAIIRDLALPGLRGVFHCFSGTVQQARHMIDLGFALGIGGVVTYKNAGIAEVLADISVEHLVLETDGPYLAPVPFRGKRNAPAYLVYIAEKLAEIKGMPVEELAEITTANASSLFRL
jgi:TatD DNase family protein